MYIYISAWQAVESCTASASKYTTCHSLTQCSHITHNLISYAKSYTLLHLMYSPLPYNYAGPSSRHQRDLHQALVSQFSHYEAESRSSRCPSGAVSCARSRKSLVRNPRSYLSQIASHLGQIRRHHGGVVSHAC